MDTSNPLIAGVGLADARAQEPLAGAARLDAERDRPRRSRCSCGATCSSSRRSCSARTRCGRSPSSSRATSSSAARTRASSRSSSPASSRCSSCTRCSRCASSRSTTASSPLFRDHMKMMRHEDTTLWCWQVVTGFALFFLAAPHLYVMLTQPGAIGPFESRRPRLERPLLAALHAAAARGRAARRHRPVPAGGEVGLVRRRRPERDAQAAEDAQVGADRVLPRARACHARGLHQDRHRARAELRRALRAGVAAAGAAQGGDAE